MAGFDVVDDVSTTHPYFLRQELKTTGFRPITEALTSSSQAIRPKPIRHPLVGNDGTDRVGCPLMDTDSVIDTYSGPAGIHNPDGYLGAVHADVIWQGSDWWGVLIGGAESVHWMSQDLTLKIERHPAAPILIDTSYPIGVDGTDQWTIRFRGSGPPPFWGARPQDELIEELRNRRPAAGAIGLDGGFPSVTMPDPEVNRICEILKERDGLTAEQISEAGWS